MRAFTSDSDPAPRTPALPVLVVGGGVAGLAAALDLGRLGVPVLLVERDGFLGGQVMRLDKLYPTDHCGFCPVWTESAAALAHPLVAVRRHTRLLDLEPPATGEEGAVAVLETRVPAVDPALCVACGLCREACAARGVAGAMQDRPVDRTWDPAGPPCPSIDFSLCNRCGACVAACPVQAVALERAPAVERTPVADVVFATGFAEPAGPLAPEFGRGSHPDILTALEFEALSAEANGGELRRRSNGATPRSLAFIQCAGARDARYLPYCAGVCCMHALKQARWARRRMPGLACAVFFTDLRAVGKGYEAYARAAADEGILLLRSRPGLVLAPEPAAADAPGAAVAVRYEDFATGRAVTAEFDLVVLNGGLAACPLPGAERIRPKEGPVAGRSCGFCAEPADVAQSVVQGARAAALVAQRLVRRAGGRP